MFCTLFVALVLTQAAVPPPPVEPLIIVDAKDPTANRANVQLPCGLLPDHRDDRPPASANAASSSVQIELRVVDWAGMPIVGVDVRVRKFSPAEQARDPEQRTQTPIVEWDGKPELKTNQEGVFRAPGKLAERVAYVVELSTEGYLPAASRWTSPDASGLVVLPDVVLRQLQRVSGQVVDRQGQPVTGARVVQSGDGPRRTETTTDSDGRFVIDGVPEGGAFLLIDKPGYWFTGRLIETSDRGIMFEITPRSERNREQFEPLPPPVPKSSVATTRTKALEATIKYADQVLAAGSDQEKLQQISTLAALDAAAALERVQAAVFQEPRSRDAAVYHVAFQLATQSPEEAINLIATIEDMQNRCAYSIYVWDQLPSGAEKLKLQLLDEVVLAARTLAPERKSFLLTEVARRLIRLGQRDRAAALLHDAVAIWDAMPDHPSAKQSRGWISLGFAPIDKEEALEQLAKADASGGGKTRVAAALAAIDPAEAERLFGESEFSPEGPSGAMHWHCVPRFCYSMAKVDVERARRAAEAAMGSAAEFRPYRGDRGIAGQTDAEPANVGPDLLKAITYAAMARTVEQTNSAEARMLLAEAVELLVPLGDAVMFDSSGFMHTPSVVLVSFLPLAERVHPELVAEMFWRAIALRLPADATEDGDRMSYDISLALLAGMLARYDRTIARAVLEPVLAREQSRTFAGVSAGVWAGGAAPHVDPDRALAWAASLSDRPLEVPVFGSRQSPREFVSQMIAKRLASDGMSTNDSTKSGGAWRTIMSTLWLDEFVDPEKRLGW